MAKGAVIIRRKGTEPCQSLFQETFGVHSSSPELACPSSSVLQQLEDREWKVSLKKNLKIASKAVYLEGKCSESLAGADLTSPETPFLFQLEKTMLDLSSPSLTDGEIYCSFFKLGDVYYCGFFESGVLQGYFLSEGMSQLKNYFEEHRLDMTKLVWLQVSTQDDIKQYHRRYTLKLERKRSHHSLSNPGSDTGRRYVNLLAEGVFRDTKGYLTGNNPLVLFPLVLEDGCLCGAGYSDDDHPNGILTEVKYRTVVYLTNGPARFEVFGRNCLAANAECQVQYGESSDSLHFLSKETDAGDEIGWDFVDHALNTHVTFSAYCKIMSKKYRRNFLNSAKFKSPQTFIAWWFSWSSKFKTDFRKPCSICKYNPKFLACDVTKIGISFKNADTDPIEKPTSTEKIDPCHRRNDRCFLNFNREEQPDAIIRKCRDHLAYTSKKALGQLNQTLEFEEELIRNTLLIETVSGQCSNIMRKFVCYEYPESVQKKLAVIFKFLSTNHSLSSLIPFRYTDLLDSILLELRTSTQNHRIHLISDFSPEIRDTLYAALPYEQSFSDVISLFQYLVLRIQRIREKNKDPAPAVRQPSTYNPERYDAAYYFTPSGEKLRDILIYTMNENAHSKNYDDPPSRSDEQCNKIYPEVSRRSTAYLFLWFDPKHYGHCYGFHIIPGSEGRKDPFSSAYSYLEHAREEVFYDFSCQFEEYCLNREPGFWENTRFWHDLFHGYSHKCPFCYKSQRICPLQGLNTEICEQFNSFIQKIKYSARSMSLGNFFFYH